MKRQDKEVLAKLRNTSAKIVASLDAYGCANILWAMVQLEEKGALVKQIADKFLDRLQDSNGQDCANYLAAIEKLGLVNHDAFH